MSRKWRLASDRQVAETDEERGKRVLRDLRYWRQRLAGVDAAITVLAVARIAD